MAETAGTEENYEVTGMEFAKRMDRFGEGIFTKLAGMRKEKQAKGERVIDLSIGAPNIPPAEHIRKALCEAAMVPENYVYAINDQKGLLEGHGDVHGGHQLGGGNIVAGAGKGLFHGEIPLCFLKYSDATILSQSGPHYTRNFEKLHNF